PNYINELKSICLNNNVDVLIPTIDYDLLLLAENKKSFDEFGTKVLISDKNKIEICRDKRLTSNFFFGCGLLTPKTTDNVDNYCDNYPAFIKPIDGSSSINAFKVNNYEELCSNANKISKYIIQPFVDGKEYTIDIFCDFDGNPIYITPRERLAVRSGEVLKSKIVQDDKIIEDCKKLIKNFKPCGPITVQMIRDKKTNKDYYIEINPRFGGGAPLSIKAGANSPLVLLKSLSGYEIKYKNKAAEDGLIYSRFDQSICVSDKINKKKPLIKAVIFDLDDTLYSEKEYVKSGFKTVSNLIPELSNAETLLNEAFNLGLPAIDEVLKNNNLMFKKAECVLAYRNHFPNINFRDGILELLIKLKKSKVFIGIITDGRIEGQKNKIRALDLNKYVDSIIITDELGGPNFRKPCDIAFRIMQLNADVPFENMVYIGDNISKDFVAPQILGMQSIMLEHEDNLYKGISKEILTMKNTEELRSYLMKNI
ncbi:MAG: HAD hydrolase-like protein, partial [Christensenellaceae bacterium]|nr:HAD hydrolase-like protein [Christensenellaceae bacterium]